MGKENFITHQAEKIWLRRHRTSERPSSVRLSVRTDYGGGEGSLAVTLKGKQKNPILS